ncbi:MAG: hypothetical protein H6608_06615 [Flavobacteriales bacterium]|nr:hypothetical protein [Bacteroidota bacterium]MCB9240782.1 hypothetical protein [Flavobacteriales bacterium]
MIQCRSVKLPETGKNTVIQLQHTASIARKFSISFDTLYTDSRCPTGVMCVWEGDAHIGLTIQHRKNHHTISLHTSPMFQMDTTINEVTYRLDSIQPYPVHGESIDPTKYRAFLTVLPAK